MIGGWTGFILAVALAVIALPAQAQSVQLARLFQQFQLAQSSGDTDRAIVLAERLLERGDRELAPNSPDTLILVETLARLRMTRNQLSQARLLYQRALQIRQGQYGEGHPELVPVLYVLADLAIAEQRIEEAETLLFRILDIEETVYGEDHPNTALVLERLARLYREHGRKDEAAALTERAASIRRQPTLLDSLKQREKTRAIGAEGPANGLKVRRYKMGEGEGAFAVVRVFYGTNRARTGSTRPAEFYGADRGELELGHVDVSIPAEHLYGKMESPYWLTFGVQENPAQHIVLLSVKPLDNDGFFSALQEHMGQSPSRDLFLFVHGYNVSFKNAARRTAQIAYDLDFDGTPVLYSWPSQDGTLGYFSDEASVRISARRLRVFLEQIVEHSNASRIHLIAHSMGNRALLEALEQFVLRRDPPQKIRAFDQIILTAPDVDVDFFVELSRVISKSANRITLYASENDMALNFSSTLHGGVPRAGTAGPDILVVPGLDTIDMSQVETDFLGHSYYGDDEAVILDLLSLFWRGSPPTERCGMQPAEKNQKAYWVFRTDDCRDSALRKAAVLLKRFGADARERALQRLRQIQDTQDAQRREHWTAILKKIDELLTHGAGRETAR